MSEETGPLERHPFDNDDVPDWVVPIVGPATEDDFGEAEYLLANPDVRAAIDNGTWRASARDHFMLNGRAENRQQFKNLSHVRELRSEKIARLYPHLRTDLPRSERDGLMDFLSEDLRASAGVSDTAAISSMGYDQRYVTALVKRRHDLVLDCGAGSKRHYWPNVVNLEIAPYPSTDVLGIGEDLPFEDDTFDMVISVAVLEHVRDPFRCMSEIARVLRPGGEVWFEATFMQPFHGYPDHYFNTTPSGVEQLMRGLLDIERLEIGPAQGPAHSISWVLGLWSAGLPDSARDDFRKMTVEQLLNPWAVERTPCWSELDADVAKQIAAAFSVVARKPSAG